MEHIIELIHKFLLPFFIVIFAFLFLAIILIDSKFDIITRIKGMAKNLSSSKPFLVMFFLASFLCVSFFANSIVQRFSIAGSEYLYSYQAETFLKGKLWNNPPPSEAFQIDGIVTKNNKYFPRCFPGWSFILAVGMFLHIPSWLIDPICGTVSLILFFLIGKLLYNSTVGLFAVLAVLCSPFYLFNAASFFPHVSCGLLLLLAVYFYYSMTKEDGPYINLIWMGACLGGAFLIRPFSTLCCLVPLLVVLIMDRKGEFFKKDLWLFLAGIAPFLLINFSYNHAITGNYFLSPFNWSDPTDTLKFNKTILMDNLTNVEFQVLWMNPAVYILYFFLVISLIFQKKAQVHEIIFLILAAGCFFYTVPGWSYGSRYYFEGYFLCVLTVIGRISEFQNESAKRYLALALIAGFFTCLLNVGAFALDFKKKIHERSSVYRLVKRVHLSNAIVLMPPSTSIALRDNRNDPDLQNDILFAHDLKEKNAELLKYYPTRDFYRYLPEEKDDNKRLQKLHSPLLSPSSQYLSVILSETKDLKVSH